MDDAKTISEIGRSVDRVEAVVLRLAQDMQAALGPIAVHSTRIEQIDRHLEATDAKIEKVQINAAYVSGAIAGAGVFLNWLMGRHG